MTKYELSALTELMMVSDPWPISSKAKEVLDNLADQSAREHGFSSWIAAYVNLENI